MDDLSNKERLAINVVPVAESGEAGFQGSSFTKQEQLSGEQPEKSPNPQARSPIPVRDDLAAQLFSAGEIGNLRSRWESIQVGFVDEPKRSVKEADQLVGEVISHLAEGFATERHKLESQWDRSDDVSTEDLRRSFRRYRSIFQRLLTI